jgi:hypothetical protein
MQNIKNGREKTEHETDKGEIVGIPHSNLLLGKEREGTQWKGEVHKNILLSLLKAGSRLC